MRKTLRRLTPSCRSQCFGARSPRLPPTPTPAEFTRTSSRPWVSACSRTSRSQSSSRATSTATAAASSSRAAASTFSRVREASVSASPSSRSMRAIASPIPDEPPVTSAAPASATGRRYAAERSAAPGRESPRRAERGAGESKGSPSPLKGGGGGNAAVAVPTGGGGRAGPPSL